MRNPSARGAAFDLLPGWYPGALRPLDSSRTTSPDVSRRLDRGKADWHSVRVRPAYSSGIRLRGALDPSPEVSQSSGSVALNLLDLRESPVILSSVSLEKHDKLRFSRETLFS